MNAPGKHGDFVVGRGPESKSPHADRPLRARGEVPAEFLILLLSGFSQLGLSSLIDPLRLANALFVQGRQFTTCAGEFAAFDLAVDLIQDHCGGELVRISASI